MRVQSEKKILTPFNDFKIEKLGKNSLEIDFLNKRDVYGKNLKFSLIQSNDIYDDNRNALSSLTLDEVVPVLRADDPLL